MISSFSNENFAGIVDRLTSIDADLKRIVDLHGYPPMWTREPGFESLVLIILEQQVSLASAFAAFSRLKSFLGVMTPEGVLAMSDEELRDCYLSRQKARYVRHLAGMISRSELDLASLADKEDEHVSAELKQVTGIGNWTADVYLIFCLQRSDRFPVGDLAMMNSLRFEKNLPAGLSAEQVLKCAEGWRPWRTVATMILWHAYIRRRSMNVPDSYRTEY